MHHQNDLIAEFDRETTRTRKVLDAIPADADFNFKPDPQSMSLGRLAGHLTEFGEWAHGMLTRNTVEHNVDRSWKPFVPASKSEALEKLETEYRKTRGQLMRTEGEAWDRTWRLIDQGKTHIEGPKHEVFRDIVMNRMIYHRGQLAVYLRLLGAKVPGVYGMSAEEN